MKARALGGEAWGGEEPALSVMKSEMRQDRQRWAVSSAQRLVGPVPPGRAGITGWNAHLILSKPVSVIR